MNVWSDFVGQFELNNLKFKFSDGELVLLINSFAYDVRFETAYLICSRAIMNNECKLLLNDFFTVTRLLWVVIYNLEQVF